MYCDRSDLRCRPTSGSLSASLKSLFYLHNEFGEQRKRIEPFPKRHSKKQKVSIHSHVLGALLFLSIPFYFRRYVYDLNEKARPSDLLVFTIYALGVAVCFVLSAM